MTRERVLRLRASGGACPPAVEMPLEALLGAFPPKRREVRRRRPVRRRFSTAGLELEAADAVARAASSYRRGGAGFSDLMIVAAARREGAETLSTFDRKVALLEGATLLEDRIL